MFRSWFSHNSHDSDWVDVIKTEMLDQECRWSKQWTLIFILFKEKLRGFDLLRAYGQWEMTLFDKEPNVFTRCLVYADSTLFLFKCNTMKQQWISGQPLSPYVALENKTSWLCYDVQLHSIHKMWLHTRVL